MDKYEQLNNVLLYLFNHAMDVEERVLASGNFKNISVNDMHIIDVIGPDGAKSMSALAKEVGVTVGTLTIAMNNLVKKGYVEKVQSSTDKREYHLHPTKKYIEYYSISYAYLQQVVDRAKKRFTPEDLQKLEQMLRIVSDELMPEIPLPGSQAETPRPGA